MTPLAFGADLLATLAAVGLAAAYLIGRGVRVWRRRGASGCACPSAQTRGGGGCGAAGGPSADDLRAAAARGARRAASESPPPPR